MDISSEKLFTESLEFMDFEKRVLKEFHFQSGGQIDSSNALHLLKFVQDINFQEFFSRFDEDYIVNALIKRSYWHPSGFIRSQLFRDSRNFPEIRLHHWQKHDGNHQFDEALHEHPWDSISIVLEGTILNQFWSISEGFELPLTYFETKNMSSASYSSIGTCATTKLTEFKVTPLQFYWIPSGVFHRTTLLTESAITLFVRGPFLRLFSLMASSNGPATYETAQSTIEIADILKMVKCLKNSIIQQSLYNININTEQSKDFPESLK